MKSRPQLSSGWKPQARIADSLTRIGTANSGMGLLPIASELCDSVARNETLEAQVAFDVARYSVHLNDATVFCVLPMLPTRMYLKTSCFSVDRGAPSIAATGLFSLADLSNVLPMLGLGGILGKGFWHDFLLSPSNAIGETSEFF
ncbi:hypothetical protein [Burkholderia stagnalis]|uniref:hypothetical protein n=1 Tax=Burkholderia stagnalis TaxID=1503054 RepID=UPI000F5B107F|nr:hypothetical protein [Burkholderia stagnalis]